MLKPNVWVFEMMYGIDRRELLAGISLLVVRPTKGAGQGVQHLESASAESGTGSSTETLTKMHRAISVALQGNGQENDPYDTQPVTSLAAVLPIECSIQDSLASFEVLGGRLQVTSDPNYYCIVCSSDGQLSKTSLSSFMPGGLPYWQHAGVYKIVVNNSRYVEIGTREMSGPFLRLWIGDVLAQCGRVAFKANAGVGLNWTVFDLGFLGTHEIGIEVTSDVRFYGIRIERDASVSRPDSGGTVTALFLGDSYTSGKSEVTRGEAFVSILGRYLGFRNIILAGVPGSGYVTSGGRQTAMEFLQGFIGPYLLQDKMDPDVIFVNWGYNDLGPSGLTALAALVFWRAVRSRFPRALIVIGGIWTPPAQDIVLLRSREDDLKDQFDIWSDCFSIFIRSASVADDRRSWLNGTGTVARPHMDGNNDLFCDIDQVHPTASYGNDSGQWYLATCYRDAVIDELNVLSEKIMPGNFFPVWPIRHRVPIVPSNARVQSEFFYDPVFTGGGAIKKYSVRGDFPPGLVLDAARGQVIGKPSVTGKFSNLSISAQGQHAEAVTLQFCIDVR